uniref:Uncharacterized protein n=1 Tax=Anguilla anguilla TaxID=7936 RepID=A0A0E9UU50_ANGAN
MFYLLKTLFNVQHSEYQTQRHQQLNTSLITYVKYIYLI